MTNYDQYITGKLSQNERPMKPESRLIYCCACAVERPCGSCYASPGMTLLGYFAAKAMQGLLANPSGPIQANGMNGWNWCNCTEEQVVEMVFGIAETMLAESTKRLAAEKSKIAT